MDKELRAEVEAMLATCAIYDFLNLEAVSLEGDLLQARVPLIQATTNHVGIMHASVLFAVGEVLGGLVTVKHLEDKIKFQPVVRNLKADFKAPAMTAITAEARFSEAQAAEMNAALAESSRYDFELKAILSDENGTVVAETLGAYAIRNFTGK